MRALAYHPLRVRVAYAEMATAGIYCDLAACPSGHRGQIIHNTDEASWCVLAESLDDLLARASEIKQPKRRETLTDPESVALIKVSAPASLRPR